MRFQHTKRLPSCYTAVRAYSAEPLPTPSSNDDKVYPEHIVGIVDSISKLNLLEVSRLNELLKVCFSRLLCSRYVING